MSNRVICNSTGTCGLLWRKYWVVRMVPKNNWRVGGECQLSGAKSEK